MRVRRASEDEWECVRELRLRALLEAPDSFGSTFEAEAQCAEADWRSWVTGWDGAADQALFLFERDNGPAGLALGVRWENEPDLAHVFAMWVALYERCGFVDTGERRPLRDGSDVITTIMQRSLWPSAMSIARPGSRLRSVHGRAVSGASINGTLDQKGAEG